MGLIPKKKPFFKQGEPKETPRLGGKKKKLKIPISLNEQKEQNAKRKNTEKWPPIPERFLKGWKIRCESFLARWLDKNIN